MSITILDISRVWRQNEFPFVTLLHQYMTFEQHVYVDTVGLGAETGNPVGYTDDIYTTGGETNFGNPYGLKGLHLNNDKDTSGKIRSIYDYEILGSYDSGPIVTRNPDIWDQQTWHDEHNWFDGEEWHSWREDLKIRTVSAGHKIVKYYFNIGSLDPGTYYLKCRGVVW